MLRGFCWKEARKGMVGPFFAAFSFLEEKENIFWEEKSMLLLQREIPSFSQGGFSTVV